MADRVRTQPVIFAHRDIADVVHPVLDPPMMARHVKPCLVRTADPTGFISSAFLSGQRFAEAVRGHWGLENSRHWVLLILA